MLGVPFASNVGQILGTGAWACSNDPSEKLGDFPRVIPIHSIGINQGRSDNHLRVSLSSLSRDGCTVTIASRPDCESG